ncbi:MAG TPA: class I SAM-dependent methyltransferase [Gemmataceae bacterium]|nr:class I SAM-dependent methyltransferase [Gemmataceae bacterium]
MPSAAPQPDPSLVLELMDGFRFSKAMFAAISLGVFDRLADGPASLAVLAKDLNVQSDALERLLGACVAVRLLTQSAGQYANTPTASVYLCKNSPRRLTGYINYSNMILWQLWARLEDAVREGTNRWKQAFGTDGPIFAHIFRSDESKHEFLMGMHGYGMISSPEVVATHDLSRFRKLVDLGGATGHLAIAACSRYPNLRAVVFDLPAVVPVAREQIQASPVADRVETVAGDFFADALPEADLFAVGRILHDWSEEKIHKLLRKIYDRLPVGGALLVAEKLLNDDKSGPPWAVSQSLNMLLVTEGKERALGEYTTLLKAAGFGQVEGRRTNSPLDAILAVKTGQ